MINKVIIVGRLTKDPKLTYTSGGTAVANFDVATNEYYNNEEKVEYHKIICWKKTAENAAEFLGKGSLIYLEGKIQHSSWEDKEGVKHYKGEVNAFVIKYLSKKKDEKNVDNTENPAGGGSFDDDDIPF